MSALALLAIGWLAGTGITLAAGALVDKLIDRRDRRRRSLPPATPSALERQRRDNVLELRTAYPFSKDRAPLPRNERRTVMKAVDAEDEDTHEYD